MARAILSCSEKQKAQARASYIMELIWSAANILFLIVWYNSTRTIITMSDNDNVTPATLGSFVIFEPAFLSAGFCNYDDYYKIPDNDMMMRWATTTQMLCFLFDIAATIATLIAMIKFFPPNSVATATTMNYLVHGLAHGAVSVGWVDPQAKVTWADTTEWLILGSILTMGPVALYQNLTKGSASGRTTTVMTDPKVAIAISVAVEIALVIFFVEVIQNGVCALLYINVTINLCSLSSGLLSLGYKTEADIAARLKGYGTLTTGDTVVIWPLCLAVSFVMITMWVEPIFCSKWYARMGGHIWFDISLFLMGSVTIYNSLSKDKLKPKTA